MVFKPLSCIFPCGPGQMRHMVAFMLFTAIIIAYLHRSVFNIAIVEMTTVRKTKKPTTCPVPSGQGNATIANIGGGKVDWTEQEQQILIASFFPIYFLLHVPGGLACDRYGGRHFLLWSQVISVIITAITPTVAVSLPWWITLILRLILGAVQGVLYPAIATLMSRWTPPSERSTVGGAVFAANAFGLVLGNLGTALMIKKFEDWRIPYYVWSVVGAIYCLIVLGYVFSDPRLSPFITKVELEYLQSVIVVKQKMNAPFWKIMADPCVWGIIAAQCGHGFIIFMLSNNLPKYLNNVLAFDIAWNGVISLLFILQWLSGLIFGMIADFVTKKKNANISWMRKIYTAVSNVSSAAFLIGVNISECNHCWAIIFFAIAIFIKGIFFPGMKVNIIDISVNHSALIMSIVNGIGALPGFFGTYIISVLVPNNAHPEWRLYFFILLAIQVVTSIIYLSISSSERRKWDYPSEADIPPKKKPQHWWLQMTPSDDKARLEKDQKIEETRKAQAKEAKEKARQAFLEAKQARRAGRN